MIARDLKRLERLCKAADRLIDMIDDARSRGIIGDWSAATTGRSLRYDLAEFHDWQLRKLAHEQESP